jgi:excisionase family DNA binding protein
MLELKQYGELLSPSDVAEILKIHPNTVRQMGREGKLPFRYIGSRLYIAKSAFLSIFNDDDSNAA